jgi:hypothetical protein
MNLNSFSALYSVLSTSSLVLSISTLTLALFASGCGERGPQRVRVTGLVTFEGQPVPYGNITFEPDTSQGNSGPQGYAKIQDGKYDSDIGGIGPCPGPQTVIVEGYPELGKEKPGQGRLVFNHRTSWDLPTTPATKDFDIPASSATRHGAPAGNVPPP